MRIKIKTFLFYFGAILLLAGLVAWQKNTPALAKNDAIVSKDSAGPVVVSLSGNGYLHPGNEADTLNVIDSSGLSYWNNPNESVRVYFYPKQNGKLNLSLRLRSPSEGAQLSVGLDQDHHPAVINIPQGSGKYGSACWILFD